MKRQKVFEFLDAYSIPYRLQEHEAVFTVAESSKLLTEKVPVKTLLVGEEKGTREIMVAMRGDERLDMKRFAVTLGVKKLRFVKPERVEELVGVKPGSVSVFGLLHSGAAGLLQEKEIGFHPNDNTATVFMQPNDALRAIDSMGFGIKLILL